MIKKVKSLCITLRKKIGYAKEIDDANYISLLIKDDKLIRKYTNKSEIKSATTLNKNLIANQLTMKNI